jgi:CubicO group peptidase (beta-lactamase class C family)
VTDFDKSMNDPSRKHNPIIGTGGLQSTLYDLFKFAGMMLNKGSLGDTRILSRKSVEAATRNHLKDVYAFAWDVECKDKKYGLGWSIAYRSLPTPGTFAHEGAGRCAMYIDPAEEFIAIYFVPTKVDWVPESLISPLGIMWGGLE